MKIIKKSIIVLTMLLVMCSCSEVKENEYLDKSTTSEAGKEDVEILVRENSVGDKYAIATDYGNRLSYENFIVREYSSSVYTANFENIENNWWVFKIYTLNEVNQVVDTVNDKKWQVNIDEWLRLTGNLDDSQGIYRSRLLTNLDGDSVKIFEIAKMIVEEDVERIEEFQKKPGNAGQLPGDFDPKLVEINFSKYVENERQGKVLNLNEIVRLVDTTQFSEGELNETAYDILEKSYISNNTHLLIQKFTNISHINKNKEDKKSNESDLLSRVTYNKSHNENVYFLQTGVNTIDIQNVNLLSLFPTLSDDLQEYTDKTGKYVIFFKFQSLQTESDLIKLLVTEPDSLTTDKQFKFEGHYRKLSEGIEFDGFDEIMDFLEKNRKDD